MTSRRDFLKGLAAGLVVAALPLGQGLAAGTTVVAPPAEAVATGWTFDAPLGVFLNPELTEAIREAAEQAPGKTYRLDPKKEYGRAWERSGGLTQLTDVEFTEMVQYARKTLGRYGEVRASIPTDFGRKQSIAWYVPRAA